MRQKKYKMELWDMMQSFFKDYNDHMMHGAFYFDGKLNFEVLQRAVEITLDKLPILKSRFVKHYFNAYWEEIANFDIKTIFERKKITDLNLVETFLEQVIDEEQNAQIKIAVYEYQGKDILALLINHMCFDGDGFKNYLIMLSEIYNGLLLNKNYLYEKKISKNRSFETFFKSLSKEQLKIVKERTSHGKTAQEKIGYPFSKSEGIIKAKIIKRKLSASDFLQMRTKGRQIGVTVNDIIIASLICSLDKLVKSEKAFDIDCIIDLRRYLKPEQELGFTNFVSKIICEIGKTTNLPFDEVVKKVHKCMEDAKNDMPGVDGLILLRLGYALLPYSIAKKVVKAKFNNPLVAISNIGIIDDKKIVFHGLSISDAYLTGSIKHDPYIQLALTTFKGEITFTIALYGIEQDYLIAGKLIESIIENIKSL